MSTSVVYLTAWSGLHSVSNPEDAPASIQEVKVEFSPNGKSARIKLNSDVGESVLNVQVNVWVDGSLTLDCIQGEKLALSRGVWTETSTYTLVICSVQTPYSVTLTFKFGERTLNLAVDLNVAFAQTSWSGVSFTQAKSD